MIAVSHNLNLEGAPNSQFELITGLQRQGVVEPIVLCPCDGPLRSAYHAADIPLELVSVSSASAPEFEETTIAMARAFRELGAEVVYANTLQTFWAITAAERAGLPAIWNVHESEPWQSYFDFLVPDIRPIAYQAFAYPYRVVFVADATRRIWEPVKSSDNFATINNGIDMDRLRLRAQGQDRSTARAKLHIGETELALVLLGTVCERKGQLDLVRAVALLPNDLLSQLRIFIVGDRGSPYSLELNEEAGKLPYAQADRLIIVPETDDALTYFRAADIALCCSRVESYPRVTLEAMAFDLPVITTPVFGIAEQMQDGVNALFYEPGDVRQLAGHITRLVTDQALRRQLASNSRRVLEGLPNFKDMIDAYVVLFSEARLKAPNTPSQPVEGLSECVA